MGQLPSFIRESFPSKPQWSVDEIPDLTGKVMIVTGANTGIGKANAKVLLMKNATVYIDCRSQEKANQTVKDLKAETNGKEACILILDLGSLKSVKKAAEEFLPKESELHVLFNNAGVMFPPVGQLTDDGYDLQFGTNVIGHVAFTKSLLPALVAGGKSEHGPARVINSSSIGHRSCPDIDFNTVKDSPARIKKGTMRLYSQSKFGNILFSNEFARRYADQGIISIALNPGAIASNLYRHTPFERFIVRMDGAPMSLGTLTQLRAGTTPEAREWNGLYLVPWAKLGAPHENTENVELAKQLWEYMEEQITDA